MGDWMASFFRKVCLESSKTVKKTAVMGEMIAMRGPTPRKRAWRPSCWTMVRRPSRRPQEGMVPVINRVLITSTGQVIMPATAPEMPPTTNDSFESNSRSCSVVHQARQVATTSAMDPRSGLSEAIWGVCVLVGMEYRYPHFATDNRLDGVVHDEFNDGKGDITE